MAVCCDLKQFQILQNQLNVPKQIMSRCPSCFSNFANFWCQFACSPKQSNFVKIMDTDHTNSIKGEPYVTRVIYNVDAEYAIGMFDSCKEVGY